MNNKGFVIVIVMAFVLILTLGAASIFFMVNSELLQATRQINTTKAFYVAEGGAERMFTFISNNPALTENRQLQGYLGGDPYDARTGNIYQHPDQVNFPWPDNGLINITSVGTSSNVGQDVVAAYVVRDIDWGNPSLMTIGDTLELQGHKTKILWFWITAGIDIAGPIGCGGTITKHEPTDTITITGQEVEDLSIPPPQFMSGFDANRDDDQLGDTNGDGQITLDEVPVDPETGLPIPEMQEIFDGDDVNSDSVINEKDGFTHFYTKVANYSYDIDGDSVPDDLGMDPDAESHPNYYSGNQTFGPGGAFESVPADTNIVFVDGDVDIVFNPDAWGGGARDITVVSTGDTAIIEPCNGDDDRLTLINYGDVSTGGINIEFIDIIDSNLNVYAHGDFYAYYGGDTEGTLISQETIDVDTIVANWTGFLYAREIGNNDNLVTDPPIGLPPMNLTDNTGTLFVENVAKVPLDLIVDSKPYSWSTAAHAEEEE